MFKVISRLCYCKGHFVTFIISRSHTMDRSRFRWGVERKGVSTVTIGQSCLTNGQSLTEPLLAGSPCCCLQHASRCWYQICKIQTRNYASLMIVRQTCDYRQVHRECDTALNNVTVIKRLNKIPPHRCVANDFPM